MRESEFWRHRVLPALPLDVFARRIEDSSGNLGTFDVFLARDGRAAWLELKVAGPNEKPNIRAGQPAFAEQCVRAKIPCGYLVGSPKGQVRLLGPRTTGADWREHLVARWVGMDTEALFGFLWGDR